MASTTAATAENSDTWCTLPKDDNDKGISGFVGSALQGFLMWVYLMDTTKSETCSTLEGMRQAIMRMTVFTGYRFVGDPHSAEYLTPFASARRKHGSFGDTVADTYGHSGT